MALVQGSERIIAAEQADPSNGTVRWSPIKSIWIASMSLTALLLGPLYFTWQSCALFLLLCVITLCAGHSVGMHRRLIHNSFECPLWLEYILVELGTLVGMAGPIGMIRQHDLRDWAQRQTLCHDYLCHRRNFLLDGWWQLHCELHLSTPPSFKLEPRIRRDWVYRWMERTWMWQQLPIAVVLYLLGGVGFVIWGVCARVAVCVTGHWLIGYFAHRKGPRTWHVDGAGVQGFDVPLAGLISMGESWHNNHHAYPGSARIGLTPEQPDPGWWLIKCLESLGLVWNIRTPETMPVRSELRRIGNGDSGCRFCRWVRNRVLVHT